MAGWLRVLTAVAFAVHVVAGCCSHHAHAAECGHDASPSHSVPAPGGACVGDWGDHALPAHSDCQGLKCVFSLRASSDVAGLLLQGNSVPVASVACDGLKSHLGASSQLVSQHFFMTGRLLMPIRLHLADQVLLD